MLDRVADDQRDEKLHAGADQDRDNRDNSLGPVRLDECPDPPDNVLVKSPSEHLVFDPMRANDSPRRTRTVADTVAFAFMVGDLGHQFAPSSSRGRV
ncbi:hypothetical protein [Mesorhizobium salmacidum]|uniref:Uncharacterized protein n=1 Tax=Mesorhizobium salmacidum TaxID=3015171 RepID=A0ABU8L333_9HYPH